MRMKNKAIVKVTKKEKKLMDGLSVCSIACQKLIEQVVKHFENNELAQREWWKQAGLKYNLDFENYEYSYKPQTEEIVLVGSIQEKAIRDLVSNINARNFIRDEIKKAFKGKSPTPEGEKENL